MRAVSAQASAMLAAVFAMLSRGARASGSSCELVYLDIGSNIGDSLHSFAFHRPAKVLALARSSASPHHERREALYALHPPDSLSVCLPPSLSLCPRSEWPHTTGTAACSHLSPPHPKP